MNKTEICDLLVKQGIIEGDNRGYVIPGEYHRFVTAHVIASDPRVAMAVMEKMPNDEILIWQQKYPDDSPVWIVETSRINVDGRNENLSAAIIEAYCEAVKDD